MWLTELKDKHVKPYNIFFQLNWLYILYLLYIFKDYMSADQIVYMETSFQRVSTKLNLSIDFEI